LGDLLDLGPFLLNAGFQGRQVCFQHLQFVPQLGVERLAVREPLLHGLR